MPAIKFDLGKNIVETAKDTGVPNYEIQKVAGSIIYGIDTILPNVTVIYDRPGYEITGSKLFAFTMYANHDLTPDDLVDKVTLQIDGDTLTTDEVAEVFIEQIIAQFQRGKWKRFIRDDCPRVTGRSSLLDLQGHLNPGQSCGLDPSYKLTREEWLPMMKGGQRYVWIGDGVLAELTIDYSEASESMPMSYQIFLNFQLKQAKDEVDARNLAEELKKGDAKGWNSTAKYNEGMKATAERNKQLEANASKRGDSVVPSN